MNSTPPLDANGFPVYPTAAADPTQNPWVQSLGTPAIDPKAILANPKIIIHRLLLKEVPPCHNQYFRSYHTSVTHQDLNVISDRITQAQAWTPNTLKGVAHSILNIKATPEAAAPIVNGWGTKRMRFVMDMEFNSGVGSTREVALGFTDWDGFSDASGKPLLAPEMVFHVNTILKLRKRLSQTVAHGTQEMYSMFGNMQMVSTGDYDYTLTQQPNFDGIWSVKPENVLSNRVSDVYGGQVYLGTANVTQNPLTINRAYNAPIHYATELLKSVHNGYVSAYNEQEMPSDRVIFQYARSNIAPTPDGLFLFEHAMNQITGRRGDRFEWRELLRLDPTLEHDTHGHHRLIVVRSPNELPYTSYMAPMNAANIETQLAAQIANVLPVILLSYNTQYAAFTLTNETPGGQWFTMPGKFLGLGTENVVPYVQPIVDELIDQVFTAYTNVGVGIELEVKCDIAGMTECQLRLNGGISYPFAIPSFADNLFAPTLTTNPQQLTLLTNDFKQVFDSIGRLVTPKNVSYAPEYSQGVDLSGLDMTQVPSTGI